MDEARKFEVALQFRQLAELNYQNENLSDACFYYINALKVRPEWKSDLKDRFLIVLSCLGQILEKKKQFGEIFAIYEEALLLYNESEEIHHNLGAHLFRLGYPDKATYYFREALRRNQNYFPAYRSLSTVYCAVIERWHYRMLNDSYRNEAYREAINKKVKQGFDTVLDIGTGTGLFSLYALESSAEKVYACECNPIMASVASNVFTRNGVSQIVKLIDKHSNDVEIPSDIDDKISLVVTETMDACMLGEHMLQSLKYAWDNILLPRYKFEANKPIKNASNNGVVIPHSGSLWFSAVQSNLLAKKYIFPLTQISTDDCTNAFANISLKENMFPENFQNLSLQNINLFASLNEPYDTERLQCLPDCTFLTEPRELFHVNFNDPTHIEKFLHHENRYALEVTCTRNGYFHAIAAWFRIQLDESIVLSSAPDDINSRNCCWDQAVFPTFKPHRVVPGSKITLQTDWTDGKVTFDVNNIVYPDGSNMQQNSIPFPVPSSFISVLNDTSLMEHLKLAASSFINECRSREVLRIMDLYPVPIFGLNVLRNAHLLGSNFRNLELFCVVLSKEEITVIEKIAQNNNIPHDCLTFILADEFEDTVANLQSFSFDVVLVNFIDCHGDLNEEMITRVNTLKLLLKEGGYLLPSKIQLCGQLIHSDYIEESMRVVNDDIRHYHISDTINEYQVLQMLELNIATLKFQKYSNPFVCHQFFPLELDCQFEKIIYTSPIRQGTINSILYWFNVNFFNEQFTYSTLHEFAYVNQAACLTKLPVPIHNSSAFVTRLYYHHGAFLITDINTLPFL